MKGKASCNTGGNVFRNLASTLLKPGPVQGFSNVDAKFRKTLPPVLQEAFPFVVASDDQDKGFKGRLFTKSFAADLQAAVANR